MTSPKRKPSNFAWRPFVLSICKHWSRRYTFQTLARSLRLFSLSVVNLDYGVFTQSGRY
jgi:hypothetical protein